MSKVFNFIFSAKRDIASRIILTSQTVLAGIMMISLTLTPLAFAYAETTVFSDADHGHNNEVLQQETVIEHNAGTVLTENNSEEQGEIPVPTPTSTPLQSTPTVTPTDRSSDNDVPENTPTPSLTLTPTPTAIPFEDCSSIGGSQNNAASTSASASTEGEEVSDDEPNGTIPEEQLTIDELKVACFAKNAAAANNSTTEDSETDGEVNNETAVVIENTNSVAVGNDVDSDAVSGDNLLQSGEDIEFGEIETGAVNVYANVLNIVNINMYNSEIVQVVENFNNLTADLYFNPGDSTSAQRSQDLVSGICSLDVDCQSLASFKLTNSNEALVENNVNVTGHSGRNTIDGYEVEDSVIRTGDVNALVNVINIVNANMVNSKWTIASFNVFGDWTGDLVMPSQMYFTDAMAVGTTLDADVMASDIQKVIVNMENTNEIGIINNIHADAGTGGNGIEATGTVDDKGGDIEESSIETGKAETVTNVHTQANQTLYNGMWFLGMVNTLGSWTGDIYSLPEEVAVANSENGLSFFASSKQDPATVAAFEQAISDSNIDSSQYSEVQVDIDNHNDAVIVNNVNVGAYTGENQITATEVERSKIITGNARALANILNFANTNLINADLYVGLTNIFGGWNGNIVFGYPDLAVSQSLLQGEIPQQKNSQVNYKVDVANNAGSSMKGTTLEWQYDPLFMSLQNVQSEFTYSETTPGTLQFALGSFGPQIQKSINMQFATKQNLAVGHELSTLAHISGSGPEKNLANNQSVLLAYAGNNVVPVPELPGNTTVPPVGNNNNNAGQQNPANQPKGTGNGSLSVTKSNNAGGKLLNVGDSVTFTIEVKNTGSNTVNNVIVYDALSAPTGEVAYSENFDIGILLPGKSATIEYDLGISEVVPGGTYTNSAYAQGIGKGLNLIKSTTAKSTFKVFENSTAVETPALEIPQPLSPVTPTDLNPFVPAPVSGENRPTNPIRQIFENSQTINSFPSRGGDSFVAAGFLQSEPRIEHRAGTVAGNSTDNSHLSLIPEASAQDAERRSPLLSNTILSTLALSVFIGLGYALSNVRQKRKSRISGV